MSVGIIDTHITFGLCDFSVHVVLSFCSVAPEKTEIFIWFYLIFFRPILSLSPSPSFHLNYANESSSRERACLPRRLCIVAAPAIPAVKEKKKKKGGKWNEKKKKPEMKNKNPLGSCSGCCCPFVATVKWLKRTSFSETTLPRSLDLCVYV